MYHTVLWSVGVAAALSWQGLYWWFANAFPAVVSTGICNLARVLVIAHIFFPKDTVGYLSSINLCRQTGHPV